MAQRTRTRVQRGRVDDLLERQREELDALDEEARRRVLQAYEDARRQLLEQLQKVDPGKTPYTHQRLLVLQAQVTQGIADMRERLGLALAANERAAHEAGMQHALAHIRAHEEQFRDAGNQIEVQIVERLTRRQGLALHRFSLDRYGADVVAAVQRRLSAGVVAGESPRELAKALAGAHPDTPIGQAKQRAELITRMELHRAYNEAHEESIAEHSAMDPRPEDPMLKRIDEFFDARNHPFSRAAHHVTAAPGEPFKVRVADVQAAAAALGKRATGIVWDRVGAFYVGQNLPAHYNDRGRIVPWRESWGGEREKRAAEQRQKLLEAGKERRTRRPRRTSEADRDRAARARAEPVMVRQPGRPASDFPLPDRDDD